MEKAKEKNTDFSVNDEEKRKSSLPSATMIAIAVLIVVLGTLGILQQWLGLKKSERKTKSQIAKSYGVSKQILMRWVKDFCPKVVATKYISLPIHKMETSDIYPYLGEPLPSGISSKKSLIEDLYLSSKTFQRRIDQFEDFEQRIGLSKDQFKKMKVIPPLFYNKVLFYLQIEN